MKARYVFIFFVIALLAGAGGWWAAQHASHAAKSEGAESTKTGRKIRFYQCSMHPQVKSDKPGKCTICGMELSPIFEGQSELSENLITLSSNSITVIDVQTDTVKRVPLTRTLRVAGTIDDDQKKHRFISAYIDGRLDKLFVNYVGAEVSKGQPLATFYSPMLVAAQREYLVLVERTPTNAAPEIREEHERFLKSSAQRLMRLGLTEKQIAALRKNINASSQTEIVAPMSGTVVQQSVYEGQYVKEGDKLFEIADFSTMWFQFDAYERDLPWLKVGQAISVKTPAVPGKVFEAKISFIDPNLNDPTRSAKVRVEISNPVIEKDGSKRRELFHRLYAEGSVKVDATETLAVSRSAVLNAGGEPLVYVAHEAGGYEPRKIKLGRSGDEYWEVTDGLAEGEQVVTKGNLLIDAQAQLNQNAGAGAAQSAPAATNGIVIPSEKLTAPQQELARQLFIFSDALAQALASDDLKRFNEQLPQFAFADFFNTFAQAKTWQPLIEPIDKSAHITAATSLADARKMFVPFGIAVADFAKAVRLQNPGFEKIKIYQCPMVGQAVPGAPKKGFWIQAEGPLRNPFFGAEMPDCGTEVKP